MTRRTSSTSFLFSIVALLAAATAGCSTPMNETVPQRDGTLIAPTSWQAETYCGKTGATLQVIGKAPAETGVRFRCI